MLHKGRQMSTKVINKQTLVREIRQMNKPIGARALVQQLVRDGYHPGQIQSAMQAAIESGDLCLDSQLRLELVRIPEAA
jgi:hypothetical protein